VVAARKIRSGRSDLFIIVILEFVMMNARAARATSHGKSSLVVVAVQPAALFDSIRSLRLLHNHPTPVRTLACGYFDDFGRSQKLPRCTTLTRA
jgi:hypothetical protein